MPSSSARKTIGSRALDSLRIEPGELRPTFLLASFLLLGMASVICLKAVSDSVFLSEFDASRLPWVDLAVTGLVGLVVNYYLRWTGRAPLPQVIQATQAFLIASLLAFWLLLKMEAPFTPVLIYLWVGIFAVLIPSQVWSLAGLVFTTRQAKRLFALVGSGGILGAALGGSFAGFLTPTIGAEAILPAAALFVAVSAWIARSLRGSAKSSTSGDASKDEKAPILESFELVRKNRYLLLIALAIFVSTLAGTLVKYQFKAIAQIHFEGDRDALASFSGYFYGYIAVFSFLFHTFVTGRLLRAAGLSWSLFVLPLSLMTGMGVLTFSATIFAAVFARAADQGFRHSIDRSSSELLYVPVPAALRARVKSFLDMAVSRSADGLASLVLLALIYGAGAGIREISWVGLAFGTAWLAILWRLRGEYVRTLRSTIERRDVRAETLLERLTAAGPTEELESNLASSDQQAVEAALGWIRFSGPGAAQSQLAALLKHPSEAIRRKTMRAIVDRNVAGCEREALAYLRLETDVKSSWLALDYLLDEERDVGVGDELREMLSDADPIPAAIVAARLDDEKTLSKFFETAPGGPEELRAAAAWLIGRSEADACRQAGLSPYLSDDDAAVVLAALESAARLRAEEHVPRLLELLGEHRFSSAARRALAAYGPEIAVQVAEPLRDPSASTHQRRQAARALGAVGGAEAVRALLGYLRRSDAAALADVLRALTRIRTQSSGANAEFDRPSVELLLDRALRRHYQAAFWREGLEGREGGASDFVRRAAEERAARALEEAFTLLALLFPAKEIRDAQLRIASGREDLRANAVEFLDSRLLGLQARAALLPALEASGRRQRLQSGVELFGLERLSYVGVLRQLLETGDPWLQSCACAAAAEQGETSLRGPIGALGMGDSDLLRETARAALMRLGPQQAEAQWRN